MKKLWPSSVKTTEGKQKNKLWSSESTLDQTVEAFETKEDLLLDQKLVKHDVLGSLAHAKMLYKIGILSQNEFKALEKGLWKILALEKQGKFKLQFGDEDIHTKIENYLTDKYAEIGKRIHTGRSRNDQILTALRLYSKDQLLLIWEELINLIYLFLDFAKYHEFVAMPGYTHTQKAMPSSIGMWSGSFAESLLNDLEVLKTAYKLNNQSPLGSAAGYGVPLNLDREFSANLLGFEKVQTISLYCQNSRGKMESIILSSLINVLLSLNKFASDLLLFTTSEFDYFKVDETLCTGSSIMPKKRNVDIAELLRSKVHLILGNYTQIVSLCSNLISGYNRDLQDSKKPLMDSLEIAYQSLKVAQLLIGSIYPKKENIKKAVTAELFATHKAFELVEQGISFREAYQKAAGINISIPNKEIKSILQASNHIGGTGNLGLEGLVSSLKQEEKILTGEKQKMGKLYKNLLKGGEIL